MAQCSSYQKLITNFNNQIKACFVTAIDEFLHKYGNMDIVVSFKSSSNIVRKRSLYFLFSIYPLPYPCAYIRIGSGSFNHIHIRQVVNCFKKRYLNMQIGHIVARPLSGQYFMKFFCCCNIKHHRYLILIFYQIQVVLSTFSVPS